jgi:hypothetical protein
MEDLKYPSTYELIPRQQVYQFVDLKLTFYDGIKIINIICVLKIAIHMHDSDQMSTTA